MLSKKMLNGLNDQMKNEFNSAYIYLGMSAWFETQNLRGMAKWMMLQYEEEIEHALKFYHHIVERGGAPVIPAMDKPAATYKTPLAAFEAALKHEKFVTSKINDLHDLALAEKDKPAEIMLHWFITEQVEEEANVGEVIEALKMVGESGQALFLMDRQLAQRTEH